LCTGTDGDDPIIEMVDTVTLQFEWSKKISGAEYSSVANIKFSPDGLKVGGVLNLSNIKGLTVFVIKNDGTFLFSLQETDFTITGGYYLFSRSLLVENDGALVMTLFKSWEFLMFKIDPPSSAGTQPSTFVIEENTGISIDYSLGFNIIHDDINKASMGYYVSSYVMNKCTGAGCTNEYFLGAYLAHVTETGSISWEANPAQNMLIRL